MIQNSLGQPLDDNLRIELGDRVRVQFGNGNTDLTGDVIYIPKYADDIWIILSADRLNYIQAYTVISKILPR